MIIDRKSPTSSDQAKDQRAIRLADQVKLACWGHSINDVGAIAVGLLMNVILQKTESKEQALEYVDLTAKKIHEVIARDYDEMMKDMHTVTEQ
jgi:hypothetical protein